MKSATKITLLSLFALVAVASCSKKTTAEKLDATYTWEKYAEEHSKFYESEDELAMRRDLFEKELQAVLAHNALGKSWKAGMNHMSDWTHAEKKAVRGYHKHAGHAHKEEMLGASHVSTLESTKPLDSFPRSVDWRTKPGVLTAVKNQGSCGSCWTFAATETIESHYALATGYLQDLSEQQIASCAANPRHCGGTGGCEGGTAQIAFDHVIKAGGLSSEWTYPYLSFMGQDKQCYLNATRGFAAAAKVESYVNIKSNDEASLMEAIQKGPVAISVDASSCSRYESGIYDGCNMTSPEIDHAVQLVGYGVETHAAPNEYSVEYWIVRNSWSPTWGEKGFIRVARGGKKVCGIDTNPAEGTGCTGGVKQQTVCGMCGILFDNAYPVIGNKF